VLSAVRMVYRWRRDTDGVPPRPPRLRTRPMLRWIAARTSEAAMDGDSSSRCWSNDVSQTPSFAWAPVSAE
jgi:hypothetical protein